MRAGTHWQHYTHRDGIEVNLIDGNEGTGLGVASVRLPNHAAPPQRLDAATGETMESAVSDAPGGLILFGANKWRRARYERAAELVPEAEEAILHAVFRALLARYGNVAELARRSGLTSRALTYKRDGERRVTRWDVWALERALQLREPD